MALGRPRTGEPNLRLRLSGARIQESLRDWLGLSLSKATIHQCLHEAGRAVEPVVSGEIGSGGPRGGAGQQQAVGTLQMQAHRWLAGQRGAMIIAVNPYRLTLDATNIFRQRGGPSHRAHRSAATVADRVGPLLRGRRRSVRILHGRGRPRDVPNLVQSDLL